MWRSSGKVGTAQSLLQHFWLDTQVLETPEALHESKIRSYPAAIHSLDDRYRDSRGTGRGVLLDGVSQVGIGKSTF